MTSFVPEHGKLYVHSANFPITLQTDILSTESSDFLKQMIIYVSFNFVFIFPFLYGVPAACGRNQPSKYLNMIASRLCRNIKSK